MITLSLTGTAADYINNRSMVKNPSTPDERAFADFWRKRRESLKGHRVTLTAPEWVMNWIADDFEALALTGAERTSAEASGMDKFVKAVLNAGIRKPEADGPTRLELIEAGYLTV